MYQAMTSLGFAAESPYRGPIRLEGDPKGASVVILGAGLAGHDRRVRTRPRRIQGRGSRIQFAARWPKLDHPRRRLPTPSSAARRSAARSTRVSISIRGRGGSPTTTMRSSITAAGSASRSSRSFSSTTTPICMRRLPSTAGRSGSARSRPTSRAAIAELLAKATRKGALDEAVTNEDQEILLEALRAHGGLDDDFRYRAGDISAAFRGYARDPGGGLGATPANGEPIGLHDLLTSRLWRGLQNFALYDFQTTMFQPVGGMGRIGEAFARQVPNGVRYGAKVTAIRQDDHGVAVVFEDLVPRRKRREGQRRLVRLHFAAIDPEPDRRQCLRADEGGDRRGPLRVRGQDRTAVPPPLLGGGRADLRRHYLHRPADPPDRLPELGPQRRGQGGAARRLHLGRAERLRAHRHVAGRANRGGARLRRPDPSAISKRIRNRRLGRLASRAVHARLRRRMDRRGAPRALRQSLPDRRPDRAGRRARLLYSGLAGGRDPVGARRDHAPAPAGSWRSDATDLVTPKTRRRLFDARHGPPRPGALRGACALRLGLGRGDFAGPRFEPGPVIRRAGRRGALRRSLRRLPSAGRKRRERRRRLSRHWRTTSRSPRPTIWRGSCSRDRGGCRRSAG